MSELEEYKEQLKDVEDSLLADPDNQPLKELQKELTDLIQLLSQETLQQEQYETPKVKDTKQEEETVANTLKTGDIVYAKPKLESTFKEAKITNVSGNLKTITLQFLETNIIETYPIEQIQKTKPKLDQAMKYRLKQQKKEADSQKPSAKKEYENELINGATSWKNFTKKKGLKSSKSQFKTSDKIGSKIGVIGSGSVMSAKKNDKTHRYNPY